MTQIVDGRRALILKLLDAAHQDIFLILAYDLMQISETRESESDALAVALARTWRWHHLLKGGGTGKLGSDEQKGLVGELLVLKRHLLPMMPVHAAIDSWKGPFGSPKDFEIGRLAIEVKARRGASAPFVVISSEHQLDTSGCDCLLLHVVELDKVSRGADSAKGVSIASLARDIRQRISTIDYSALDLFDASLMSSGVSDTDEYLDDWWVEGRSRIYEVRDDFPRVVPSMTGLGVRNVQYALNLVAAEVFVVRDSRIVDELERQGYVGDH